MLACTSTVLSDMVAQALHVLSEQAVQRLCQRLGTPVEMLAGASILDWPMRFITPEDW